jgi:altronate hydrolase
MKHNAVVIDPADNVATLLVDLQEKQSLVAEGGVTLQLRQDVEAGHKVALRDLAKGEIIRKYGYPIGVAGRSIAAGEHVHTHNLVGLEG